MDEHTPEILREAYITAIKHFLMRQKDSPPVKLREVAKDMNISAPKATELLRIAWEENMIQVTLRPPDDINPDLATMHQMEQRLLEKLQRLSPPFGNRKHKLIRVSITPNQYGLLKVHKPLSATEESSFESLASRVARKAAIELKRIFSEKINPKDEEVCVGLGTGRTCERIINRLGLVQPIFRNVMVCPMVGLTDFNQTSTEANFLAFRLGLKLSAKSIKLACPMLVPDDIDIKKITAIKSTLSKINQCKIGVSAVGLGSYPKADSRWFEKEMMDERQNEALKNIGAKAEINGHFLDINGELLPLNKLKINQIGIDFETMRQMDRYLVVVSPNPLKALPAVLAVKSGICSDLILDHMTASQILYVEDYRDLEKNRETSQS